MRKISFVFGGVILISLISYFYFTRKINDFPETKFDRVLAFKVDENSHQRLGKGVLLTAVQEEELVGIFQSNSTYGSTVSACFNPRLAFVFFEGNKEVANALICLECNWMRTNPEIESAIFSSSGSLSISKLENEIFE